MTDPISALGQLTPVGPNRDDLLFAAGRASARPSRWWKAVAGFLAVTQAITLAVLLWPQPVPPTIAIPVPPAVTPEPPTEPVPAPPSEPDPHSYLALMHRDEVPAPRERFAPGPDRADPPLTAGSRRFD